MKMKKESIYNDNLQRSYVVGLIQERIRYLETVLNTLTSKEGTEYKNNLHELNSLKDFLFFNS